MEKRHFGNTIAPFRLFLGQPLLATNFTDPSLLVSPACTCLAMPRLQSQPHLWLAAPQCTAHLLQMQERDTEDQALWSAHSPQKQNKKPFPFLQSSQTVVFPSTGGHQQQDLFALRMLFSLSFFNKL